MKMRWQRRESLLYYIYNKRKVAPMYIEIDFSSDEAIYIQLYQQIIMQIAADELREGQSLPSVRQLAAKIGINMHTVNKAYSILRQDGFVMMDRRRGAVIAIDDTGKTTLETLRKDLKLMIAKAYCRRIPKEYIHQMVEEIYDEYEQEK